MFPNNAENCCRKYGILRLKTLSAAIFVTDEKTCQKLRQTRCQKNLNYAVRILNFLQQGFYRMVVVQDLFSKFLNEILMSKNLSKDGNSDHLHREIKIFILYILQRFWIATSAFIIV